MGFKEIIKQLNDQQVNYIVAGGYAAIIYGVPRTTFDLDLLLDLTNENLRHFVSAIERFQYKPRVPISIYDLTDEATVKTIIQEKDAKALNLVSQTQPQIDILFNLPVSYPEAVQRCEHRSYQNLDIPILNIDDLILCKRIAGRNEDLSDISALEIIKYQRWKDA